MKKKERERKKNARTIIIQDDSAHAQGFTFRGQHQRLTLKG